MRGRGLNQGGGGRSDGVGVDALDNRARDIVETPLDRLKPHPRNPNRGNVEAIRKSIRRNRWFGVLVAQRSTGFVLAGNHRLLAARAEGLDAVPVHWVDVSDEDALRILLADNKTAEDAARDPEALAALLDELAQTSDLEGTGYDAGDLDALLEALTPKTHTPDAPEVSASDSLTLKWGVARGQWWRAGDHQIYCGPCEEVQWPQGAALFWDPPWDAPPAIRLAGWSSVLAFCDGARLGDVVAQWGPQIAWLFVWDCVSSWYTPNRPLRRGKLAVWYGDVGAFDFNGAHYGDAGDAREVQNTRGAYTFAPDPRGKHLSDVFSQPITRLHAEGEHKHEKPIDWVRLLIGDCTRGLVCDPCAGSGAAVVACEQLGRESVSSEIDPAHCAAILERLSLMGLDVREGG